jgi:opacity protein-like surface antigen
MRKFFIGSLVLSIFALSVATASAQDRRRRQPHTGSEAVGFEVGAFVPNDDQFNSDLLVNGLFEYYVRPRVSLRTEFGLTDPGHTREPVDSLRQVPLRLDVNYNWEGGVWHPFVGAGIGAYFLRNKDNGVPFGTTYTEPGINLGGGLEYFLNRRVTLKGEARYHRIDSLPGGPDPSGWALTLGMKRYY